MDVSFLVAFGLGYHMTTHASSYGGKEVAAGSRSWKFHQARDIATLPSDAYSMMGFGGSAVHLLSTLRSTARGGGHAEGDASRGACTRVDNESAGVKKTRECQDGKDGAEKKGALHVAIQSQPVIQTHTASDVRYMRHSRAFKHLCTRRWNFHSSIKTNLSPPRPTPPHAHP